MDDAPAKRIGDWFSRIASRAAELMGSASAFVIATVAVLLWAISGPLFGFSDTWQLIINTATTVLTFLAVFLIQHSQNRDARASQLKLDDRVRTLADAINATIDRENRYGRSCGTMRSASADGRRWECASTSPRWQNRA